MNTHVLHRRRQYDSTSQSTVRSTRTFIFLSGGIQTTRLFIIIFRLSSILSFGRSKLFCDRYLYRRHNIFIASDGNRL